MMMSGGAIERECRVFTEFLIGCAPDRYVVRKYADAHQGSPVFSKGSPFDSFLVRAARAHRLLAKTADAYARLFLPSGLLRRKLVLLLAILETCSPSSHRIDSPGGESRTLVVVRLGAAMAGAALAAITGTILFAPVRIIFAILYRSSPASGTVPEALLTK